MKIKRMFALLAVFCLCLHTVVFAATPSNALKAGAVDDVESGDFGIIPFSMNNPIYGHDWAYVAAWHAITGSTVIHNRFKKDDSGFYKLDWPRGYYLDDYFSVDILKPGIPSAGKYRLQFTMYSGNSVPNIQSMSVEFLIRRPNTVDSYQRVNSVPFKTYTTRWTGNFNIEIPSNCQSVALIFHLDRTRADFDMSDFTYKFYQVQDSSLGSPVVPPSPPSSTPDEDIADAIGGLAGSMDVISSVVESISGAVSDISGGIGTLVSSNQRIIDLILQVIQTISNQLEAFWNQLAGEFTNLYNKLTDQHNELMDADRTNVEDHMEHDDYNTDRLIDALGNQGDENRDGYDDSGWQQQKDRIDGVIADYEDAENELLGGVKDNLDNFAFDNNPFTQFNVVMADISPILTGIYDALGSFNIPIGFSLTLTVAMLCIGWYRFKGGL